MEMAYGSTGMSNFGVRKRREISVSLLECADKNYFAGCDWVCTAMNFSRSGEMPDRIQGFKELLPANGLR